MFYVFMDHNAEKEKKKNLRKACISKYGKH